MKGKEWRFGERERKREKFDSAIPSGRPFLCDDTYDRDIVTPVQVDAQRRWNQGFACD